MNRRIIVRSVLTVIALLLAVLWAAPVYWMLNSAFLDKFSLPDKIEMQFGMPGWSQGTVDAMTAAYLEDIDRIRARPEVRFISA